MTGSTERGGSEANPLPGVEGRGAAWAAVRAHRPEPLGDTALVLMVPAADTVIGPLQSRFDPAASLGVGAHVTVLYPFVARAELDGDVCRRIAETAAEQPAFDLRLSAVAGFPGVVYLTVEPEEPVRDLTAACGRRWPQHPPYGGVFDDVVPHLTIGHGGDELAAAAVRELGSHLPLTARADTLSLVVLDGERWRVAAAFPLGE